MFRTRALVPLCIAFVISYAQLSSQTIAADTASLIPLNPDVRTGTFANGLTWYVLPNHFPKGRVELRLAVGAGSINEDDDQLGLAHFCEHMAFNGTRSFPEDHIIDFIESSGMRFGADLNAFTSFDRTVYMLTMPTERMSRIDTAMQILREWAHDVTYDSIEIEKERGVVGDEWRGGLGGDKRNFEKLAPILYFGSRFADHLPIGNKSTIDTCHREALVRFYRDWYRPDLMAVIVVGDIDADDMIAMIERHFADIPPATIKRAAPSNAIPDHDKELAGVASDPQSFFSTVRLVWKHPWREKATIGDLRRSAVASMAASLLGARFDEIANSANPPFTRAFCGSSSFGRAKELFSVTALVNNDGVERGLATLTREVARAEKMGFTQTELDRGRAEELRDILKSLDEKDQQESGWLTFSLIGHFLDKSPYPGIPFRYEFSRAFLPTITLEDVNRTLDRMVTAKNHVVTASFAAREMADVPTEARLLSTEATALATELTAWRDETLASELLPTLPTPGRIVSERTIPEVGIVEWVLSNGARVVIKPTDVKNDELMIGAQSPGGCSLLRIDQLDNAEAAGGIVGSSGAGPFNGAGLSKYMKGKIAILNLSVDDERESMMGFTSPRDVETALQLIYLAFTRPRADSAGMAEWASMQRFFLQNIGEQPEFVLNDTLRMVMANHNPRVRPTTLRKIEDVVLDSAFSIYRDRFSDAGDFTFFFVGKINPDSLRPGVTRYLASLPTRGKPEHWVDHYVAPPEGIVETEVRKGHDPKGRVTITFHGPMKWNAHDKLVGDALSTILRFRLIDVIREDLGGSYSPFAYFSADRDHNTNEMTVSFGCDPQRIDELTAALMKIVDSLQRQRPTAEEMQKVHEQYRRARETSVQENYWWFYRLQSLYWYGDSPAILNGEVDEVEHITPQEVNDAAGKILNQYRYVKGVLRPEEATP